MAGKILAEAVAIYDGRNAVQTQSYGPEARGGASKAEVVISDQEIHYPKAVELDLLLSLTQESCTKYMCDLKKGGILIIDSGAVSKVLEGDYTIYRVPISDLAINEVGKVVVANIVALGVLTKIAGVVSEDAVRRAILARVPKGTEEINNKAFDAGLRVGGELLEGSK